MKLFLTVNHVKKVWAVAGSVGWSIIPNTRKVASSIPGQGIYISLSHKGSSLCPTCLSLSLPPSLKSINISSGEIKNKKFEELYHLHEQDLGIFNHFLPIYSLTYSSNIYRVWYYAGHITYSSFSLPGTPERSYSVEDRTSESPDPEYQVHSQPAQGNSKAKGRGEEDLTFAWGAATEKGCFLQYLSQKGKLSRTDKT